MATFLLTLFALALGLAPLQGNVVRRFFHYFGSQLWNDGAVLFCIVLLVFYSSWLIFKKIEVNSKCVHVLLLASLVLLLSLAVHETINFSYVLQLVLVLWSIPLVLFLVKKFGVTTIIILLLAILCLHSFWAIAQFILQDDLGLYPLGETRLDSKASGIAKFAFPPTETKILRAYGPYPHPNSLAGVLVLGMLVLSLTLQKNLTPALKYFLWPIVLALLLTFSRSAAISLLLLILLFQRNTLVSFGQWWARNKRQRAISLVVALLIVLLVPLWVARVFDSESVALAERQQGIVWAWNVISEQPLLGVGAGNYMPALRAYLGDAGQAHEPWQIAPVHSVPLLLLAEWGMLPFLLLGVVMLLFGIRIRPAWWWLVIAPLLLFDHYFVTQFAPLWWLVVVLTLLGARQERPLATAQPAPAALSSAR